MDAKSLLIPRFEVIADYPGSPDTIGTIILTITDSHADYFSKYPHLFRKLNWWEHRSEEQMPQKLLSLVSPNDEPYVIEKWDMKIMFGYVDFKGIKGCHLTAWKPELGYIPVD